MSGNQCQREVVIEVQERCSELLHIAAVQVDAESLDLRVPQSSADREIHMRLQSDTELVRKGALEYDITELRLCSSLFSVVNHVTTDAVHTDLQEYQNDDTASIEVGPAFYA